VRHVDTYSIDADKDFTNFEVSLENSDNLSFVKASLVLREEDDESRTKLTVTEARKETHNGERCAIYNVKIPSNQIGNSLTVEVVSFYTHSQTPLPTQIPQNGLQRIVFNGNHYVSSPYTIVKQSSTIFAAKFEDYTTLKPTSPSSNQVTFGPYNNVSPFSFSANRVHVVNNSPFISIPTLLRDIEISHWGNIAVEEKYLISHSGAELKGTFSRVEYMQGSMGNSARELVQFLPKGAVDVYYRDQIGNISSSHVRVETDGSVKFEIEPRFVLFGGWKIDFYTGYNLPISNYLSNDGNQYTLTIPLANIMENCVADDVEYKFTFPEGSSDFKIDATVPISKRTENKKFTYLDVTGRPVVSFRAKNLISEHKDGVIKISYTFSSSDILKEPLLLVAGYFAFFLACIFYFRFELSISK